MSFTFEQEYLTIIPMIPIPVKEIDIAKMRKVFETFPQVSIALLFGSRAANSAHRFSDYNFAIVADVDRWEFGRLWVEIAHRLGVGEDDIDLIDLTTASKGLKKSIKEHYILLKGNENELARLLE